MASDSDERRPGATPDPSHERPGVDPLNAGTHSAGTHSAGSQSPAPHDPAGPDATRRFDPVVPDAGADDATVRLGQAADEEALTWDGDDLTERLSPAGPAPARSGAGGAASGSALLIVYGALGGVFLLMTIGWTATALRFVPTSTDPLGAFMERFAGVLAIGSPAAWFAIAFWLTRGRPAWLRILWIALGILFVAPWQLVTGTLP
jgi:hypothetical protein